MNKMIWVCKTCGTPVYQSGSWWFHNVLPRFVATRAREVELADVEQAKTVGGRHEESPALRLVTTIEGL